MEAPSCLAAFMMGGQCAKILVELRSPPKISRSLVNTSFRIGSPPSSSISRTLGMGNGVYNRARGGGDERGSAPDGGDQRHPHARGRAGRRAARAPLPRLPGVLVFVASSARGARGRRLSRGGTGHAGL